VPRDWAVGILKHFLKIKSCKSNNDECSRYLSEITGSLNIYNVFNPSFFWSDNLKLFTFRGADIRSDKLLSFVSVEDKSGRTIKNISTEYCDELNCHSLLDPKITLIKDEFFITFNSGWNPDGNEIYIMKIHPEFESPKKIIYEYRRSQERNWAFFSQNEEIYVLYWINPLKVLKVNEKGPNSWQLEDYHCDQQENMTLPGNLTIGTQLSNMGGKYCFVAHKKVDVRGKKMYLGKFCVLDFEEMTISPGKYWLVHSLKSMFGAKIKTNTNLFSSTYFSGIQTFNETIKLGYGVNDVDFGFSTKKPEDL